MSWVLFLVVFERIRDMSKRYSQDFKDRAVRLLSDRLAADRSCSQWQAVREIAPWGSQTSHCAAGMSSIL